MRNSKRISIVAGGTAILMGVGIAFAYWTATGTGTGSASTSGDLSDLSIVQTSDITAMHPGDSPQTIGGTVTNDSATAPAYVNRVTVSMVDVTQAPEAVGDCDTTDYTLTGAVMPVGTELATTNAGATDSFDFSGATIQFNNKDDENQDGCKGATVNLAYAAN